MVHRKSSDENLRYKNFLLVTMALARKTRNSFPSFSLILSRAEIRSKCLYCSDYVFSTLVL